MNSFKTAYGILLLLLGAAATVWFSIVTEHPSPRAIFQELDVGQGDATLLTLPGGATMLIDAGPGRGILEALEAAAPKLRKVDLALITHPELDHFNGFNAVLERYEVGAFIVNGRQAEGAAAEWGRLLELAEEKHIPFIVLRRGDRIRAGGSSLVLLAPDETFLQSGAMNDTGIVLAVKTPDWKALLAADVGLNVEEHLLQAGAFEVDILKVGHHGSKYSTGELLLAAFRPRIAVIGVGARNRYGHPAPEVIRRLEDRGIAIFRTDRAGTVRIDTENGIMRVRHDKHSPQPGN